MAIGGINAENAPLLIARGASAAAVISAVSRAKEPSKATYELVCAIGAGRQ